MWHQKWQKNGWRTVNGEPVKNQDLIKEALRLIAVLEGRSPNGNVGKVRLISIAGQQNKMAKRLAREACESLA